MFKLKSTILCCALAVLVASLSSLATVAPTELWGDLAPGEYAVGFETVELYDRSRTYVDKYDYDGNLRSVETSRPIQICIWYPANSEADASTMGYGEYVFPVPEDSRFYGLLSNLQGRELGYLISLLGGQRALAQDLRNMRMSAVRDAPRVEGNFPLIIYHPDGMGGLGENAVMCEFLASHGYIVATSHAVGSVDLNVSASAAEVETMIRDREFVYGFMNDYPYVDDNRPGMVGFGMGGLSALLMQMRNSDIEAVATLDPAYSYADNVEMTKSFPSFSYERMDVPLLHMYIANQDNLDMTVVDSLKYSLRYTAGVEGFSHNDFCHYALASAIMSDTTGVAIQTAGDRYKAVCESVLKFLDTHLKAERTGLKPDDNPLAAIAITQESYSFSVMDRTKAPPTETQFVEMIQEDHIDRAVEIYEKLKAMNP